MPTDEDEPTVEVEFSYTISVPEKWLVQGGPEGNEAQWRLAGGVLDDAYDILMEGISDRSGDWFPRYRVLCLEEFMAGEVCGLERDHEGPHE